MGRLTTHVLDTALGTPAQGLKIELWSLGTEMAHVSTHITNADGETLGYGEIKSVQLDAGSQGQFEVAGTREISA